MRARQQQPLLCGRPQVRASRGADIAAGSRRSEVSFGEEDVGAFVQNREIARRVAGEDMIGTVSESDTKSGNEHVYYNIDAVTSALPEKKKLSFRYFDTDLHGSRIYRKDGERYIVNPLGLIYEGDNFYLICFHDKYTDVASYRIDRMEGAQAEKEKVTIRKEFEHFDVTPIGGRRFPCMPGSR